MGGATRLLFPHQWRIISERARPVDTRAKMDILRHGHLCDSACGRFKQRATAAIPNRDAELRKEASDQSDKGWLSPPFPVDTHGRTLTSRGKGYDAAFCFPAIQGDKVRGCDYLIRSLANRDCAVLTPIKLVSWGHVAHVYNLFAIEGLACEFPKADHRSAYKSLTVCPIQTQLAISAVGNSPDVEFYALPPDISFLLHFQRGPLQYIISVYC